jgi:hypothetical protein
MRTTPAEGIQVRITEVYSNDPPPVDAAQVVCDQLADVAEKYLPGLDSVVYQ